MAARTRPLISAQTYHAMVCTAPRGRRRAVPANFETFWCLLPLRCTPSNPPSGRLQDAAPVLRQGIIGVACCLEFPAERSGRRAVPVGSLGSPGTGLVDTSDRPDTPWSPHLLVCERGDSAAAANPTCLPSPQLLDPDKQRSSVGRAKLPTPTSAPLGGQRSRTAPSTLGGIQDITRPIEPVGFRLRACQGAGHGCFRKFSVWMANPCQPRTSFSRPKVQPPNLEPLQAASWHP
ncbi:uncharacterized protein B0H64DRAFT_111715 [Chaetomium fimeti]|uniref:Uncharacterized protein n=1 Tax=Chaetomium fimeti TaxID=1854472 RepID=A0AAE0LU43_9PEZI|nr:hypothetical protein B0H64DRAFT_111715 [Chaetomium fimeti]